MPLRLTDPDRTAADLDGALPPTGGLVLFEGVPEPQAVAVANALANRRHLRLHSVHARDLVAERFVVFQGNLREAFDEARGAAVFLLTDAEALLDAHPRLDADEPEVPAPPVRLRRYLLDRIGAFEGAVALCINTPAPGLDEVRERAVVVTA